MVLMELAVAILNAVQAAAETVVLQATQDQVVARVVDSVDHLIQDQVVETATEIVRKIEVNQ